MSVLTVSKLGKRYGSLWALRDVSATVERGEVLGFIGPNGAGKTTFLNMLVGLLSPSSGSIRVFGDDPRQKISAGMGYVADGASFPAHLSATKTLAQIATVRRIADSRKIAETLDRVGLDPRSNKPTRTFSHGMLQRLNLAQAIMEKPELLILDEPSNGLDAEAIIALRELIAELAAVGTAVVIASHLLTEIERVCNSVMLVVKGEVSKTLDLDLLRTRTRIGFADSRSLEIGLNHQRAIANEQSEAAVTFDSTDIPELIATLSSNGARIAAVTSGSNILEKEFLALVSGPPAL